MSDKKHMSMPKLREILLTRKRQGFPALNLLTLSACQSVDSKKASFGFASSAISAGVNSVLGTQWLVDEEEAKNLVSNFYQEWYINESNKAEALQKAILKSIKNKKAPYFWASFIMVGNGL